MAKIWEECGLQFLIWSNDHRPAHVHVMKAAGEIVIRLVGEGGKPEIREIRGRMSKADIRKALCIACKQQDFMLERWKSIHGQE